MSRFFRRKTRPADARAVPTRVEEQEDVEDQADVAVLVVCDPADEARAAQLVDALQPNFAKALRTASSPRKLRKAAGNAQVALVLVTQELEKNEALVEAAVAGAFALVLVVVDESMRNNEAWHGTLSRTMADEPCLDLCSEPGAATITEVVEQIQAKADGLQYDVFLSHEWGAHPEAKEIAECLERDHRLRVWLDDDEGGAAATEAIDRAKVFVVLATTQYMAEVNAGDSGCKCYKELVYAGDHCANRMVVAALEPAMLHVAAQVSDGNTFKFNIGRAPVVDLTSVGPASVSRLARGIKQSKAASRAQDSLPQGVRELYAHLSPVDSTPWAKEKAEAFSSGPQQQELLDFVGRWYQSDDLVLVVQGDANVGKSTALAEVCRRGGAFGEGSPSERQRASMLRKLWWRSGKERPPVPVAAMHFFRREVADESASTALKSIAWQLCFSVPGFANALDLDQIARAEDRLTDVFDAVLAAPAAKVSAPHVRQVVVLDALDACVDGKELIQKIIVERWVSELPPWLCLAVSTRPDPQYVRMLADFQAVMLNERVQHQQPVMRAEKSLRLSRLKATEKDGEAPQPTASAVPHPKSNAENLAAIRLPASLDVFIVHAQADGVAASSLRDTLQPYAERDVIIVDRREERSLSTLLETDPTAEAVVLVLVSEAMQAETLRGKNRTFIEASERLPTALLPVVVDAKMLTQKSWTGDLSLALGNELYVDFHEPAEADGAKIAKSVLNKLEGRRGAQDWDVFISHEWGVHDTAKDLAVRLERDHGIRVWLDESEMRGKMNEAMAAGISRSRVFLILATARYLEKVNSGDGEENCCKEFTFAVAQAHPTVVAVLEPAMLRVTSRTADGSTFNVDLGDPPVVDLTSDTEASMRQLVRAIKERPNASSDDLTLPKGKRELRARLDPLDSIRWARQKADAFSPGTRRWILDFVQEWYEKSDERVVVVQGDGGVGKSTVLAEICRRGGALGEKVSPADQKRTSMRQRLWRRSGQDASPIPVAAIHFFRHDRDAAKSTATALRSIAWQLCNALPGFAAAVEEGLMAKTSDELQALEDVFDAVLAAPAAKVDQTHPPRSRQVVVLDALDECDDAALFIQKIIVQRWTAKLPSWLCLLVSTRPEAQIPEMMQGFRAKKVEVSDEKNMADMRLHLERVLRGAVVEGDIDAVAGELTERSEGLFLWASFLPDTLRRLRREMRVERDALLRREDVMGEEWFPSGLSGMFRKYFTRFRDEAMGGKDRYELVLAPIVAAREPLSKELLHAALGEPTMQATEQLIQKGRNLLYQTGSGGVGLLHKSMADWLTAADQDEDFYVDKFKGDALLAEVLLQRQDDPFSVKHLVYHLVKSGDEANAFAILNDFAWVQQAVSQGDDEEQRRRAIGALLRDFAELGITFARETDTPRLLSKALNALSWDPHELASQVLARLRIHEDDQDHPLVKTLREPSLPWLQPVRPSPTLPHPHDPLRHVLEGHFAMVLSVAFDGDHAVSGSGDRTVRIWNAATGALQHVLRGHSDDLSYVTSVAVDGDCVVSGSSGNIIYIWSAATGALQRVLKGHSYAVNSVAVEGGRVVSGSNDQTVRIWNATTGTLENVLRGHSNSVTSVAVDGDCVVSGSEDKTARIWNAATGTAQHVLGGHSGTVTSVAVDGDRVVSGSEDKAVRVWSAATGVLQRVLRGHLGGVTSVAVEGDLVVSGSADKTFRSWNAATGALHHVFKGHSSSVTGVAIEGGRVVSGSWDMTARVWDVSTGSPQHVLEGHSGMVYSVAVEDARVVSGSEDTTVRVWNAVTGALQHVLEGHSGVVTVVLAEGGRVVSGSLDMTVRVWNAETGALQHVLEGHSDGVMCMVALKGDRVVSGSRDKSARIWNVATGELQHVLEGHSGWVCGVAVEGDRVVSGSMDTTIRVWNAATGRLQHVLEGHSASVTSVAVERDRVVSGSVDTTVRVWNAATGVLQHVLEGHFTGIRSVAVKGEHVVSASYVNTIRIWNAATGEALDESELSNFQGNVPVQLDNVPHGKLGTHVELCRPKGVGFSTDNGVSASVRQGDVFFVGDAGGMVHILRLEMP